MMWYLKCYHGHVFYRHTNKSMGKEVEMFEKFLKRLDPKDTQAKLGWIIQLLYI